IILLFDLLLFRLFAGDGEGIVGEGNLHVLLAEARKLGGDVVGLVVLAGVDLHVQRDAGEGAAVLAQQRGRAKAAPEVLEYAVDLSLQVSDGRHGSSTLATMPGSQISKFHS